MTHRVRWSRKTVVGLVFVLSSGSAAEAAKVKLTDGTEVSGTVVGRDGHSVMLKLERSRVASIDGKPLPAPVVEGAPAPAFSVTDLSGTTQTLGSAKGEVTLLHFWASWCPHCRHDVDLMKALFARYQGKGMRLVTVSLDQDMNALTTFIREQALPYPVVAASRTPDSPESALADHYEVRGFPAYFLVDAHGTIVKIISGSVVETHTDLESLLTGLLGAKPVAVSSAK